MNIVIVNQYASTPLSGSGGRSYYLANELRKRGSEVSVIRADFSHLLHNPVKNERCFEIQENNGVNHIKIRVLRYASFNSFRRVINWVLFAAFLPFSKKHISFKVDFVICSSPSLIAFWGAWILSKRLGARCVFEARDLWPLTLQKVGGLSKFHPAVILMKLTESFAFRTSLLFIGISRASERYLRENGYSKKQFLFLPNGVDVEEVSQTEKDGQQVQGVTIGYLGRIGTANAVDTLVEAAARLKQYDDVRFLIVGEGPEADNLRKRAKTLELTNIEFRKSVPKAAVPGVLKQFDFAYLGWRDSDLYKYGISPQKLPEYLAAGLPIIHAYSGADDPVQQYEVGNTVAADDPDALARAILKLVDYSEDERINLRAHARNVALEYYSYKALAGRLIDKLSSL